MEKWMEEKTGIYQIFLYLSPSPCEMQSSIFRNAGSESRGCFPSTGDKCFVQEVHIDKYGENIMVKKSRPSVKGESLVSGKGGSIASGKGESIASGKGETVESGKEEIMASGKENEGFDAVRILMAIGVVFCVISLAFIVLRYVVHVV